MATLSVSFVAQRAGVTISTLHFYETKGLISSWRTAGNQRRYDKAVLRRIAVIKSAQALGLSLTDIAAALAHLPTQQAPTKEDWQSLSLQWQQQLDEKIMALTRLRNELDQCIGCGCLSLTYCKLRNPDDNLAKQGSGPVVWEQATDDP